MRTCKLHFRGKDYLMCMSTRVLVGMEQRGLSMDELTEGNKKITATFAMIHLMSDAGNRYAKLEGVDNPGVISEDDLLDYTSPEDYERLIAAVTETIAGERKVEVEEEAKNAETTPKEQ